VLILVYIKVASAVNNMAFGGRWSAFRSLIRSDEFFMYEGMSGMRLFILKSSQVLKIDPKLLIQLTTGLIFMGVLWTLGIP